MRKFPFFIAILSTCTVWAQESIKTYSLQEIDIVTDVKQDLQLREQPTASSIIDGTRIEEMHVTSIKNVVNMVPGMFIPDYGSRLTSAIYIRGIGSRINTPAVGLYVDNVPYIDKSSFDTGLFDIERVDVLRGPQGTLYGRNTMGGLIRIFTKSPLHYQGSEVKLGVSTVDAMRTVSASTYRKPSDRFAYSVSGHFEESDGMFTNDMSGQKVDSLTSYGGRIRGIYSPNENLSFDMNLSYDHSNEGGYPYFYTGATKGSEQYPALIGKISANRESGYERNLLNAGLAISYKSKNWNMNAITGYQHLKDRMGMDQDFMAPDIYFMEQKQRIGTLTQEITFTSNTGSRWQRVSGMSAMYQKLHTNAPVTFHEDGLRWLESNINSSMPSFQNISVMQAIGLSGMNIYFRGNEFVTGGNFDTPTFGFALFHQSTFQLTDRLSTILGLRLDHEKQTIDYTSNARVYYGFSMPNTRTGKPLIDLNDLCSNLNYDGNMEMSHTRILPKLAFKYRLPENGNVYASVSMGQRAGGYNIQMISDLLQGAMRVDMMDGVRNGIGDRIENILDRTIIPNSVADIFRNIMSEKMPHFETPDQSQIVYKPEYSVNHEIGTHMNMASGKLILDGALFHTLVFDQQIARFAPSGLGRMMVNAGQSQSYGVELSAGVTPWKQLQLSGSYSYTHATFKEYDDGSGNDFNGNFVPFVPKHTFFFDAAYSWFTGNRLTITAGASCSGSGPFYWTEDNLYAQDFHLEPNARLVLEYGRYSLTFWGRNLTDAQYNTIWFESASRGYEQHCKPRQFGLDLKVSW